MGGKQSSGGRKGTVTKTSYKGALVSTVSGHKDSVLCCAFSPDGKYLATSSADHSVMVWDLPSFKRRHRLENEHSHTDSVTAVSFSPDSSLLISGKKESGEKGGEKEGEHRCGRNEGWSNVATYLVKIQHPME